MQHSRTLARADAVMAFGLVADGDAKGLKLVGQARAALVPGGKNCQRRTDAKRSQRERYLVAALDRIGRRAHHEAVAAFGLQRLERQRTWRER